jgi:hypothetical protein
MSARSGPFAEKLERIVRETAHDYENYRQRSEVAFRLSNNRALPARGLDEMRNALDHFMTACTLAFELKTRRNSLRHIGAVRQGKPTNIPLEIARCRRHIVAAQLQCLRYSLQERIKHIRRLLKSPVIRGNPQVVRYRREFEKIESTWKVIRSPSEKRNPTVGAANTEIKKLRTTNAHLDAKMEILDRIHSGINKHYKGKVGLSR